ncbi:MAG: hypothetical protein EAZ60_03480 [Oscillatoriales cyanobacterium]|nr:MAG: hypothetical protein EAZ60_03480 [Oscillatoriales cyanobacterium]
MWAIGPHLGRREPIPMGEESRDRLFWTDFRSFQGGDRLVSELLTAGMQRVQLQCPGKSRRSWQKFLRIAEYFVMFFAFLNGFDTLR